MARPWMLLALAVVLARPSLVLARPDERSLGPVQDYAIEAAPLGQALTAFGTISRVDILYESGVIGGKRSNGVTGRYTPRQALALLLQGTGLEFRFTRLNAALIFPPSQRPPPEEDAWEAVEKTPRLTLDVLRVTAPPIIGGARNTCFEPFGRSVQAQISARLQDDPRTARKPFSTRLSVQVKPDGGIGALDVARSTGDQRLDQAIRQVLLDAPVGAPPADMPQPIWFDIVAR